MTPRVVRTETVRSGAGRIDTPAGEGVVIRLLISAVLYLVANAIGLLVADALLDEAVTNGRQG